MPMTPQDLWERTVRLRGLVELKRHEIAADSTMGPVTRAHLLSQITALQDRVDEILLGAVDLIVPLGGGLPAGLPFPGVVPGIEPVPDVIGQPEPSGGLPAAPGDLCA